MMGTILSAMDQLLLAAQTIDLAIGGDGAAGLFIAAIRGAGFSVKAE